MPSEPTIEPTETMSTYQSRLLAAGYDSTSVAYLLKAALLDEIDAATLEYLLSASRHTPTTGRYVPSLSVSSN